MYEIAGQTLTAEEAGFLGGLFTALAGMVVVVAIIGIIFYVLLVVAMWKIFTKAGEAGWKSIIPIYNLYITYKIAKMKKWFWIELAVAVIIGVITGILGSNGFATFLSFANTIFSFVMTVILYNRLSKSFGHGAGYTVGLVFLPTIFTLILGFSKDEYKALDNEI